MKTLTQAQHKRLQWTGQVLIRHFDRLIVTDPISMIDIWFDCTNFSEDDRLVIDTLVSDGLAKVDNLSHAYTAYTLTDAGAEVVKSIMREVV